MEKTPEQLVREQLEAGTPRAWVWEDDGLTCVGRVVGGFVGKTKFGDRKVMTLQVDGELRSVWLSTAALEDQVVRLDPQVGDVIGIKRGDEKKTSAGGNDYWPFIATKYGAAGSSLGWDKTPTPALEAPAQGEVVESGAASDYQPRQEPPMAGQGDIYPPEDEYAGWKQ